MLLSVVVAVGGGVVVVAKMCVTCDLLMNVA